MLMEGGNDENNERRNLWVAADGEERQSEEQRREGRGRVNGCDGRREKPK